MAKDKERSVNPAAAQRKAEKARAIKKGKASVAAQRSERLAKINPARIERQLADLHSRQASEGGLPARERRQIAELEKDLERIRKARAGPPSASVPSGGTKRTRDERDGRREYDRRRPQSESSDTDESVRNIPMPRDTPPPVPTRRRGPRSQGRSEGGEAPTQPTPPVESKTVYEAKPQIRNLRKEAVGFVPAAVRQKIQVAKGQGGRLPEAEELDALERQGYGAKASNAGGDGTMGEQTTAETRELDCQRKRPPLQVEMEEVADEAL